MGVICNEKNQVAMDHSTLKCAKAINLLSTHG
jgi:hypothetical protein